MRPPTSGGLRTGAMAHTLFTGEFTVFFRPVNKFLPPMPEKIQITDVFALMPVQQRCSIFRNEAPPAPEIWAPGAGNFAGNFRQIPEVPELPEITGKSEKGGNATAANTRNAGKSAETTGMLLSYTATVSYCSKYHNCPEMPENPRKLRECHCHKY